jgi:peroxiredoxin
MFAPQLAEAEDAAPNAPSVGEVLPEFEAQRIDGSTQRVSFPKGSTTVLVFFLSGCPTCHKMIPEWNRAFERRPAGLSVVGVIMDQEPLGFFDAMPVAFPVVRSPGREFMKKIKVNRAPLTLRVGPGGTIQEVSLGLVDPIRLGEHFRR